jgi:arylsulfatase A-like enzyme
MKRPRNIVFILTDQQRYDTLGIDGSPVAKTPNLDALARAGICFDNHFVTNPVCSPSRGSIWTGLYPSQNGLWGNGGALDESLPTCASVLRDGGWQTAHFGKMHLVPILARTEPHPPYGFQTIEVAEGDQQYPPDDAYFNWLRAREPVLFADYLQELYTKGQAKGYTSKLPTHLHMSEWVADRGIDWLENKRDPDQPFFLSLGFFDPHHAFNPVSEYAEQFADVDIPEPVFVEGSMEKRPVQYQQRYKFTEKITRDRPTMLETQRAYHAMVTHVDACVGRVVEKIKAAGLWEDTVIVFSSDHGELIGDHGLLWKGPMLLDSLMHVPLIMAGGGIEAGQRIEGLTSSVDLAATFVGAAGCPSEGWMTSGHQILADDQHGHLKVDPAALRSEVYAEYDEGNDGPTSCLRMLRTATRKLIRHPDVPEASEFYDLAADPSETWNVAAAAERQPEFTAASEHLLNDLHRPRANTTCRPGW